MIDEFAKDNLHRRRRDRKALRWKLDGLSEYDARRPLTGTGTNRLGRHEGCRGEAGRLHLRGDAVRDAEAAHAAGMEEIGYANKAGKDAALAHAGAAAVLVIFRCTGGRHPYAHPTRTVTRTSATGPEQPRA